MQISNNYNAQNFKGLNYSKVYGDGLKVVKKELPQLEKLGEKYDIKLESSFDVLANDDLIDIQVFQLNTKFKFLRKLFSDRGHYDFRPGCELESLLDAVKKAIASLK